jgi:hypothetical protein
MESHSLKTGVSLSAVRDGHMKIVLNLKALLTTICMTHINVWSELMLTLNNLKTSVYYTNT